MRPPVAPGPFAPPPPGPTPYPRASGPVSPERSWSVGTILLALGAFGLVVASLIFVSRSWETIGIAGKAAILLAATVACAGVGWWATRRPLRASAEALWSVFLVLVVVDLAGGRGEGLFGSQSVSWAWTWTVIGLVVTAAAAAVLMWSRRPIGRDLVAPMIGAILGVATTSIASCVVIEESAFWRSFGGLVVAGLLGLALRVTSSRPIAIGARVIVAGFYAAAAVAAFVELVDHPSFAELTSDGAHGVPMVLIIAAAVVVASAVGPLRVVMTAVAVVGLFLLVAVPVSDRWEGEGLLLVVFGATAIVATAAARGTGPWIRGVRLGTLLPIVYAVVIGCWWLVTALAAVGPFVDEPWSVTATDVLGTTSVSELTPWIVTVAAVALLITLAAFATWPEVPGPPWAYVATAAVLFSIPGIIAATRPPWWAIATIFVVAAIGAALVHLRSRDTWWWPTAAVMAVAGAVVGSLASQSASTLAWVGGGLALAAVFAVRESGFTWVAAPAVPVLWAAAGAAGADLAGADAFWSAAVATAVALAVLLGCAVAVDRLPASAVVAEVVAGVSVVVAAGAAGDGGRAAALWTLIGVGCGTVAAVSEHRRGYALPSVLALIVAYLLLIVDQGFAFVEAYTLPIGLALLAAGVWWMRRRPQAGSWAALGAGLSVSLLPSLPQAMAEPTEVRALVLGVAAVAILGVGAQLDWQAPFVMGTGVAAAVLLCNIGPYANAAPRVVVIAVVSAILVAVGITWEDRVQDGRRALAFVKAMR